MEKIEGTVKWFNSRKGYGFIAGEDGNDYFVHITSLPPGARVNEQDRVTFRPVETDRGKQAQEVSIEGQAASAPRDEGVAARQGPAYVTVSKEDIARPREPASDDESDEPEFEEIPEDEALPEEESPEEDAVEEEKEENQ